MKAGRKKSATVMTHERNESMRRVVHWLCFLISMNAVSTVSAQGFYPDFALVVQLPSYEVFLTNLGNEPVRIDYYQITSPSSALGPSGWKSLSSAGPEIVAALGPGADQFLTLSAGANELVEGNLASAATWQPGQSWSIGFPFHSDVPDFPLDAAFHISSPDGLLLNSGTVVFSPERAPAALLVISEPSSGVLCLLAVAGISAICLRETRSRHKSGDKAAVNGKPQQSTPTTVNGQRTTEI
jgi:hypothetical protein